MPWKAGRTVTGNHGVGGYNADQPRGCGASSMQQSCGLPLASLNPLHIAECWSMVYVLYTHAESCHATLSLQGDINELPACSLQCAVI